MKTIVTRSTLLATTLGLTLASTAALAVDPTYVSQIKDALQAVNMTNIIADVGDFAALGFTLLLTVGGVFFAAKMVNRFLKS